MARRVGAGSDAALRGRSVQSPVARGTVAAEGSRPRLVGDRSCCRHLNGRIRDVIRHDPTPAAHDAVESNRANRRTIPGSVSEFSTGAIMHPVELNARLDTEFFQKVEELVLRRVNAFQSINSIATVASLLLLSLGQAWSRGIGALPEA